MNVIRTQASSQILINYSATALSFLAVILIYPLDENAGYGLAQFVSMTAMFLIPFATLGTYSMVVKFFPEFQAAGKQSGYLMNVLIIAFSAMFLFFSLAYVFSDAAYGFLERLNFDIEILKANSLPLVVMTILVVLARMFTLHSSNYEKIAIPALFNNLLPKASLPVLILLLYWQVIDYHQLVWLWTATYALTVLGVTNYLRKIGALDLEWRPRDLEIPVLKRILTFSGFNGLSMMGSMLASRVDVIMVTLLLGEKDNGVYVTVLFIAGLLQIPTGAAWQIISPKISQAWNANNLKEIKKLYQRASSNLTVVGIVIFLLCLGNIDSVFSLTANYEGLSAGVTAFAFLGLAKLLDMLTSVNTEIIMYSKAYKVNTAFVLIMGISNVFLNYILIAEMGITGAGLATFISIFLYNTMKSIFIFVKYGMQPFAADFYKVVLFGVICSAVYFVYPKIDNPFLHIASYTFVMGLVALGSIGLLKLNTDFLPFFKTKAMALLTRFTGQK